MVQFHDVSCNCVILVVFISLDDSTCFVVCCFLPTGVEPSDQKQLLGHSFFLASQSDGRSSCFELSVQSRFFPRASERRVLPIVGACKTSSHLHISSSHLLIFTSSHLHIFSPSHLLIFSSSHLLTSSHIFSHLLTSSHIFSHLLTSSHTSCPLAFLPFCPLALLSSCPLLLFYFSFEGGSRGSGNETPRKATLSHEMRFDRQKLR